MRIQIYQRKLIIRSVGSHEPAFRPVERFIINIEQKSSILPWPCFCHIYNPADQAQILPHRVAQNRPIIRINRFFGNPNAIAYIK
jgi:hypothetical protein